VQQVLVRRQVQVQVQARLRQEEPVRAQAPRPVPAQPQEQAPRAAEEAVPVAELGPPMPRGIPLAKSTRILPVSSFLVFLSSFAQLG
jgi:hypothetical protein